MLWNSSSSTKSLCKLTNLIDLQNLNPQWGGQTLDFVQEIGLAPAYLSCFSPEDFYPLAHYPLQMA